jgi:hypothetical protein
MGYNFSPSPTFQEKSDVETSKNGEVTSQVRQYPMFLSSKWSDLMKMWRRTSKFDVLLIMCLRNAKKESPRND